MTERNDINAENFEDVCKFFADASTKNSSTFDF